MEQIKNIIEKVFADKNINYQKISVYDRILSVLRRYAQNIEQINIKHNVLCIYIESAVYRNEIQMRKNQILEDLNSQEGFESEDTKIKDIKILIKGRRY
jgi:hypothetical protein